MITKKKSRATKELDKIRKKAFSFKDLFYSVRMTEELGQVELADLVGIKRAKVCDFEKVAE